MNSDLDVNETLREYCSLGNEEEVIKQLRNGAAINSQNRVNGCTALHCASRREHVSIISLLLENGADVNVRNNKGEKAVDTTTHKDIKAMLEQVEKDSASKNQEKPSCSPGNISTGKRKASHETPVNFVPGYLANPVFPYTLATANPMLQPAANRIISSEIKDQPIMFPGYLANPVYAVAAGKPAAAAQNASTSEAPKSNGQVSFVPGYLANPVYAVAAGKPLAAEEDTSTSESSNNNGPVNFVPGYLTNPVFPYAVGTPALAKNEAHDEFKQIFVPHVEQFGTLVNTYVNSVESGKHIEYRMCDSCKTTPVADVFVGTNISEIVLKVRQANAEDDDFIEIELNRKILTYEELLDVCSKEFRVSKIDIQKIRKLPNTIIRRDKDVKRLQPYQELEFILT